MNPAFDVYALTSEWAVRNGLHLCAMPEMTSTNSLAKADLGHYPTPALYLAREQTAGRGRGSHTWSSTPGALLASWCFSTFRPPQPILAPLVGLALFEAASAAFNAGSFALKAPNDLYLQGRKVAGVLIEPVGSQSGPTQTVIGVGLNVWEAPTTVATATSLAAHFKVEDKAWTEFLTLFNHRLKQALTDGLHLELGLEHRERLKNALNRNPNLPEPILSVDELAQLHTASRLWRWSDL